MVTVKRNWGYFWGSWRPPVSYRVDIAARLIFENEALAARFLRAAEAAFAQLAKFPQMGSR